METLSDAFIWHLSVWRLSVAYIGRNSRTERSRRTKIGTAVAHVTRDLDTTFKVKRSKVKFTRPLYSPPCWRFRQLQRWVWERVGREKLCCYLLGRARRFSAHGGRRGAGAYRGGRPPTACFLRLISATHTQVGLRSLCCQIAAQFEIKSKLNCSCSLCLNCGVPVGFLSK